MKKLLILFTTFILLFSLSCCAGKSENRADTSLREGEMLLSGTVEEAYDSFLLLKGDDGGKYDVAFNDTVQVVEDGWYVVDLSADSFKGKRISVICDSQIMETYPAQLQNERIIIIE